MIQRVPAVGLALGSALGPAQILVLGAPPALGVQGAAGAEMGAVETAIRLVMTPVIPDVWQLRQVLAVRLVHLGAVVLVAGAVPGAKVAQTNANLLALVPVMILALVGAKGAVGADLGAHLLVVEIALGAEQLVVAGAEMGAIPAVAVVNHLADRSATLPAETLAAEVAVRLVQQLVPLLVQVYLAVPGAREGVKVGAKALVSEVVLCLALGVQDAKDATGAEILVPRDAHLAVLHAQLVLGAVQGVVDAMDALGVLKLVKGVLLVPDAPVAPVVVRVAALGAVDALGAVELVLETVGLPAQTPVVLGVSQLAMGALELVLGAADAVGAVLPAEILAKIPAVGSVFQLALRPALRLATPPASPNVSGLLHLQYPVLNYIT